MDDKVKNKKDINLDIIDNKNFKQYIDSYWEKYNWCKIHYAILDKMWFSTRKNFIDRLNEAPLFWTSVLFNTQKVLTIDLVSFLAKKDPLSLPNMLEHLETHKDTIFTKKPFIVAQAVAKGNDEELEKKRREEIEIMFTQCHTAMKNILYAPKNDTIQDSIVKLLKKARNKFYCHYDKMSINPEAAYKEIFSLINNEDLQKVISCIGFILIKLKKLYYLGEISLLDEEPKNNDFYSDIEKVLRYIEIAKSKK